MTSALTNQRQVFKAFLAHTERVSDEVTRKIGPLDFNHFILLLGLFLTDHVVAT